VAARTFIALPPILARSKFYLVGSFAMVAADSPKGFRDRAHRGMRPVLNGHLYVYEATTQ